MSDQFEFRVQGIPCRIEVTYFDPGVPTRRNGHPDTWQESEPPYMEYDILDSRGRPAPWLEVKATDVDHDRIIKAAIAQMGKH